MVARCFGLVQWRNRGSPSGAGRAKQYCSDAQTGRAARRFGQTTPQTTFALSASLSRSGAELFAVQMSFLLDTDLLSLLERKRVPAKLTAWMNQQDEFFISVVSLAELEYGLQQAPATHRAELAAWLKETRQKFASATEPLTEPVLMRWKQLLAELKSKNRTMSCEDSLIAATALFHGHSVATHNTRHFAPAAIEMIDPLV